VLYTIFRICHTIYIESSIFWAITPCSLLKVNWHFRGTYHLHLQDSACYPLSCWFLVWLILQPWRWRQHVPPKCVDNQQTAWCHIPDDRTSDPICKVYYTCSVSCSALVTNHRNILSMTLFLKLMSCSALVTNQKHFIHDTFLEINVRLPLLHIYKQTLLHTGINK
jgi:hypothetical protein